MFAGGRVRPIPQSNPVCRRQNFKSIQTLLEYWKRSKVNADGSMTPVASHFHFPNGVGDGIGPLAVDPKGRWVFALSRNSTNGELLFAIPRNVDGSLRATSFASRIIISDQKCNTNIAASHIAIDPQGKNLFISCNASGLQTFNGIQVYGINQTTGALSRVDSFTTAHSFEALSVDRQGWRVFSDTEESSLIEPFDFNRNVDQISLLNGGILYHTGSQPNGVVVDAAINKFVYVTNGGLCFGFRYNKSALHEYLIQQHQRLFIRLHAGNADGSSRLAICQRGRHSLHGLCSRFP